MKILLTQWPTYITTTKKDNWREFGAFWIVLYSEKEMMPAMSRNTFSPKSLPFSGCSIDKCLKTVDDGRIVLSKIVQRKENFMQKWCAPSFATF